VRREAWVGTYGAVPGLCPEAAGQAQLLLGFALATELQALGAHDIDFISLHMQGYEAYMAQARPLVMVPGNDLERGRNGGAGIRAANALPALMSALDERSGIVLGAGNAFARTTTRLTRPDLLPEGGARTLNRWMSRLAADPSRR